MRRVGIVVFVLLIASACEQPWIELASRDIAGDGANASSADPALSADGRFVAFTSSASDLVPGDTNGLPDVFVRDLQTGEVELVSVAADGGPANGGSSRPSISADGSRVSFYSAASNLAPDIAGRDDMFVRDRTAETTVSASLGFTGFDQTGVNPGAISGAGTKVWFTGAARIASFVVLVVLVYDVGTATLHNAPSPAQFPVFIDGIDHGSVSHDGRYAAVSTFTLPAPEVFHRVYRLDAVGGGIDPIFEHGSLEEASNCVRPALSGDGNVFAFECDGDEIVPGVFGQNVYARNMTTGVTSLVSVDTTGAEPNSGSSSASVNSDGSRIAFISFASNLVPHDNNGVNDVFVRDLTRNRTTRVSLDTAEVTGTHGAPSLDADGAFVAFTSNSNDIVPGDSDGTTDVLVRTVDIPDPISATPSDLSRGSSHTFTLHGDFFRPNTTVSVNGAGVTIDDVVFVSPTALDVTVTVAASAPTGSRQLTALVPGPGPGINGRPGSSDHCTCITIS